MLDNTSIQEIPSIEEVSPTKFRGDFPLDRKLMVDNHLSSRASVNSSKSSPQLKRCSILCPKDQSNIFFYENQIEKILRKPERTINEAILLYKNIKNFEFFKKFKAEHKQLRTTDALLHLAKSLKFETFFPGTIIYRKDEESDQKIYLVFSGRVETIVGAQEHWLKESPTHKKIKPAKTLNSLDPKENEDSLPEKRQKKRANNKALIPKKVASKGSDRSPKFSVSDKKPELKKETSIWERSKVRGNSRKISNEESDKDSAGPGTKGSLEVMIEKKIMKEGTLIPHDLKAKTDTKKNIKEEEPLVIDVQLSPQRRTTLRSNTVAYIGVRSKTMRNLVNEVLNSPSQKDRRGSDFQAFLHLVPQIAPIDSIGIGRLTSGNDVCDTENHTNHTALPVFDTSLREKLDIHVNPNNLKITAESPAEAELSICMDSIEVSMQEDKDIPVSDKKYGIRKGGIFGDEILVCHCPRKETMVATVYTKLLTFTLDDYDYITTRFEKTNTKRLNFLLDHVPELEKAIKYDKLKNVDTYFQELDFSLHNHIVREGEKGKNIYILYEGTCRVFKEPLSQNSDYQSSIVNTETPRRKMDEKILVSLIQAGAFIGEEILFQDSKIYHYTVKASSASVKVLTIKRDTFRRIMPFDVVNGLKELHINRSEHYKATVSHKMKVSSKLASQKSHLLRKFSSSAACRDLVSSFSKRKNSEKERLDSSMQDTWRAQSSMGQDTSRSIGTLPEYRSHSLMPSKTLNIPRSQRTMSQDEWMGQEGNFNRTPRKIGTVPPLSSTRGKNLETYNKLQVLETKKTTLKEMEESVRVTEGDQHKFKNSFTKFYQKSALNNLVLTDHSTKTLDETLPKSRINARITTKGSNTTISQLPKIEKIDPLDINGFRFDFGNKKERSFIKESGQVKGKLGCASLKNSRESSPRNMASLICMMSPKNSNFLINHAKTKAGSTVTPNALIASCKEAKEEMEAKPKKKNSGRIQRFSFAAVLNASPITIKSPKGEQSNKKENSELKYSFRISKNTTSTQLTPQTTPKSKTTKLILQAGVLGRGFPHLGSRDPSEGRISAEK